MYRSILIPLSAGLILVAFVPQAMAQFNIGPGTFEFPGAAATTTVKSSKSNSSDRMGGGGGTGVTAKTTTVKSSKSNSSDRMGGGGGKSPARSINLNSSRSNNY